jgi:endonuclease-3
MHWREKRTQHAYIVCIELARLYPNPRTALHYHTPWQLIVVVSLSAQTTDKKVNEATPGLFAVYPDAESLATAKLRDVEERIKTIGLYKGKAKRAIAAAQMLIDEFNGEIPKTIAELSRLPGVGRKTANVVLTEAYGITEGIAVDTHVTRLARKFGLTKQTDPKKIEKDLMDVLPKEEWRWFTLRMIEYGREYSPAHKVGDNSDPISQVLARFSS